MRIQPWMKAVTGAALMMGAQATTSAQPPAGSGQPPYAMQPGASDPYFEQGYYSPPGPGGYYAPSPATPGGSADPHMLYPQGVPQSFQPWPEVSPYYSPNVGQTQHYNEDGLWFRELFYRQRTFNASIEALSVEFRGAGTATVGSPYAKPSLPYPGGALPPGQPQFPQWPYVDPNFSDENTLGWYPADRRILPLPALSDSDSFNGQGDTNLYPIRSGHSLGGSDWVGGLQAKLGFMNEDYTGVQANVWWGFETGSDKSWGYRTLNGIPVNQNITLLLGATNVSPIYGNIPLYNGESFFPNYGAGSTAKYDIYYGLSFKTEAGGTNLSMYSQPIVRNGGVMIRPLWGLRYLYINEAFQFRGIDSGLNYTVDPVTFRPDTTTPEVLYAQYEAKLNSGVQTHLAGPEIGFRIDLGDPDGRGFRIWGESILGLAANYEQIKLNGDNIGDPLMDVRYKGFLVPRILDDANYDSTFSSRKNSAHVSPTFQQSIFADFNFLDTIPVIRNMEIFEEARLRLGYTFLVAGSVSRPMDSINWQGFPLYPEIKTDRTYWWTQQLSLGIDWTY